MIVKAGIGNNFNNNIEEFQFDDGTLTDADVALLIGSGIPAGALQTAVRLLVPVHFAFTSL